MSVLVGQPAPDFTAPAVMPDNQINDDFNLRTYLGGRYGWLVFYPLDFTFVCPSEILAHDNRREQFEKRNVALVAISVDSVHAHFAWKNTPVSDGGLGQVGFPIVSDIKKEIAQAYDVLHDASVALRASFLIDKAGMIQHQVVNNLALGRNADEALRMVDALQHYESDGQVCPAGWQKGDAAIDPSREGVAAFLSENADRL